MSAYLRMWQLIKETPLERREEFLKEHSPAQGIDLLFAGERFFDVDLLEAVRHSIEREI